MAELFVTYTFGMSRCWERFVKSSDKKWDELWRDVEYFVNELHTQPGVANIRVLQPLTDKL